RPAKADERQNEAEEKEPGQRVLATQACHLQLAERSLVDQRPPEVESLDDGLHANRLLLAQAFAAAIGLCCKAGALFGSQLVALKRDRLHARLELVAA